MRSRRRGQNDEPTMHDRWLVSYADFITLLFALFVLLFASSYRDKQDVAKISQAIHVGFQELGAFAGGESKTGSAYRSVPADPSVTIQPEASKKNPNDATAAVDIAQLKEQLQGAIGQELEKHEVETRMTPEGFVISLNELGFFDSGQAVLLPGAAAKIERIAKVLALHGLNLRVEGNSDDVPIHTAQFHSNWELSTARAMAVMQLLVDGAGFDPKKISIAAYGQYRPVADNSTAEGRGKNRRVDLVVVQTTPPQAHTP